MAGNVEWGQGVGYVKPPVGEDVSMSDRGKMSRDELMADIMKVDAELRSLQAREEEAIAAREEWQALWEKASMSVFTLQDDLRVAQAREEELRTALERMTHEHCGTNRVTQSVRWARQTLGWEYDKGCAESVEAVRRSHAAIPFPSTAEPED